MWLTFTCVASELQQRKMYENCSTLCIKKADKAYLLEKMCVCIYCQPGLDVGLRCNNKLSEGAFPVLDTFNYDCCC